MKKPNILILHGDQHRFDCLGCYGNKEVCTPNLDALAAQGVRYTEHYTVYPVCTPSRYSMLCGLYPHQHTAWSNESTLPSGVATFPRLLREKGYRTAAVGKMHFSPTYLDVGFDRMLLAEQNGQGRFEDDYHSYLAALGLVDAIDLTDQVDEYRKEASPAYYKSFGAVESDLDAEHHSTGWITRQALQEIDGWSEEGNLLMVGYVKPHHPFDPPAPYSTMYDPNNLTLPEGYTSEVPAHDYENYTGFFDNSTLTPQALRQAMAGYYGCITQMDDAIGQILEKLREKNLYENTLIVYTSDHGEYLGHHHMLLKSNHLYDPLMKIPLFIKYPEEIGVKGVNEQISENIDLSATLLDCCGLPVPGTMCGQSLLRSNGRDYAFSAVQFGTEAQPRYCYMVRSKAFKLIVNGAWERAMFFDLAKDPQELHNAIDDSDYREEIARHRDFLVNKMLFAAVSRNHLNHTAPQMHSAEVLARRSKTVQNLAREKLNKPLY